VAVAVRTTAPAAPGAVYVVAAPLAVCAGLKLPQVPAGVQVQSTPALVLSFATVAVREVVPFVDKVAGGAAESVSVTAAGAFTAMIALAMILLEAVEVALTVTLPAVAGAVYVVAAPLAVCVGLNVPQEAAGAQDQSTPALELSLETVTVRDAVALGAKD
jgi:hypothetical protein